MTYSYQEENYDVNLVVNAKSEKQTKELYENLAHKLGKNP